MEDKSMTVVYVAGNNQQAHMLKNVLRERDIWADVTNEVLGATEGDLLVARPAAPQVVVAQDDAAAARAIVSDFDRALRAGVVDPELMALEEQEDLESFEWPCCPSCRRRRHTSCPVCETAGTDFAPAFMPDEPAAHDRDRRLVVCAICDEVFAPRFPARCEWCGYRFADGYEPRPPNAWTPPFDQMTGRAWLVVVALGILLSGVLAVIFSIRGARD